MRGRRCTPRNSPFGAAHVAELGREEHLVAAVADRPADQLLVLARRRTCRRCRGRSRRDRAHDGWSRSTLLVCRRRRIRSCPCSRGRSRRLRGRSLPSRRLAIWNMSILPFRQPPSRAACFFDVKWDRHPLVATGVAGNDRNFGTADPERLGEQPDQRLVRCAIGRSLGDPHLQLLASVRTGAPAADAGLRRARRDPNGDDVLNPCTRCASDLVPRLMNNSSGSTAKVTIIISLKSSR